MIIDNLESLPDEFKQDVRGILLIHRNKDGNTGNAQRKSIKKISRNADEWNKIIQEFRHLQQHSYPGFRIYSSVNSRNISKAIHLFKMRQLEMDYGSKYELEWYYVDIQNRFFSCLMNPSCKSTSNFLVDCDTLQEYEIAIKQITTELILFDYATKNGRHLICKPFNPSQIQVEIKKDDLIYIG